MIVGSVRQSHAEMDDLLFSAVAHDRSVAHSHDRHACGGADEGGWRVAHMSPAKVTLRDMSLDGNGNSERER
jgi:hypothetical protein